MRNFRERAAAFLHFLFEEEAFTLGRGQACPDLRDVSCVLPQGDELSLLGPQRSLVSTGGCTRRGSGRLLGPGLAPLLENPLTLVEFLDALRFPEAGHQESVAFLCQLVDDVIHRGVGTRDDADGLTLRDEGGDQVEDRLCLARAGRTIDDRDLVGERGANRIALINVGVEGHEEMVARARRRGRRPREERFEGGPSRRLREPLPDVCENGRRCRRALAHPPGIALARVQRRPGPSRLRTDFLADIVKDGGVLTLLRRRERCPHLVASVAPKRERAVSFPIRQRVARITRVTRAAERPDDLDAVPALPAHPDLIEGVDLAALNLVVEAYPILAVWILFAVGIGDDDAIPVAARLRDFPGVILPVRRVLIANQDVHRARIDGFHTPPP